MKHQALEELFLINKESRQELREVLLNEWVQKWVYHSKQTQHVLNKSILNSNELDFVWYKVAEMCSIDLMDNGITRNSTTNNSFTCETWALRSPYAELEKNKKNTKKIG